MSGAGDGAAGADARHEMRDLVVGGLPDFRTSGVIVAFGTVRIVVLVGTVAAGNRLGEAVRHLVVGARIVRTGVGGGYDHFGAVCAQHRTLGFGNLVRQGEDRTVSALQSHERESDTGVAGGRFHDHAAGLQFAAAFGRVDDAFGDAVLGRATRVQVFDLHRDGGFDAVGHVVEFDERGVADEFCGAVVDGHDVSFGALRFRGFGWDALPGSRVVMCSG